MSLQTCIVMPRGVHTSWNSYVEDVMSKYDGHFLWSSKPLSGVVNVDRKVYPIRRFVAPTGQRRVLIIGRVPFVGGGLKMGIQGNRHSIPGRYLTPIRDGEVVQDVLPLETMKGEIGVLEVAWTRQLKALRKLDQLGEEEIDNMSILDAPYEFEGLIKGPTGFNSDERIDILWEKFRTIEPDSTAVINNDRSLVNVKAGTLYSPKVLDYGTHPYCEMVNDALVQHNIFDEHGFLIPPWLLMNEIRPGSIVLVTCAIHERNTVVASSVGKGHNRYYELRGHWAKVLKRGRGCPLPFPPAYIPSRWGPGCDTSLGNSKTLLDYPGFSKVDAKKTKTNVTNSRTPEEED